jgi:hypothetical protein
MEHKAVINKTMAHPTMTPHRIPIKTIRRYGLALTLVIASLAALPASLQAQARPTESKAGDLTVGAGFSAVRPDYGHGYWLGPAVFGSYGIRYHLALEVDIHLMNFHTYGNQQAEDTYEIGGRYNIRTRFTGDKITIYPKVMYGRAVFDRVFTTGIPFNLSYNMYTLGGGIEYKLKPHITIRVGDFEAQRWIGFPLGSSQPSTSHGLTPYVVTSGVAYHF